MNMDKIEDATLALMLLGLHDENRAWKGFDWDAMNRLYEKGYISSPVGKAKAVTLSEKGLCRAQEQFGQLFGKQPH